jgi:hypothetical protein
MRRVGRFSWSGIVAAGLKVSLVAMLSACAADADLEYSASALLRASPERLDVRRTLAVTDVRILKRFPLARVMDQLARDTRIRKLNGITLFKQWWNTQNPSPVDYSDSSPHCDDEQDALGRPLLNGYPYDCRPSPSEGAQVDCDSFDDPACAYVPIGLFNRFDLAPPDGSDCGQHRIVYAKQTGQTAPRDRNLVIFEAVVPNPTPRRGIMGCQKLVEAWAQLSFIDDIEERADRLERMYFKGSWEFGPVVSFENFGDNEQSKGQIRTNQFMGQTSPPVWTLREFKLLRECDRAGCRAAFVPETVKDNPIGLLFGDPAQDARTGSFQAQLTRDKLSLLVQTSVTDISLKNPEEYNSGQSHSSGSTEMDFATPFATQRAGFRTELWKALGSLGSDVTPEQVVARARTQTCAGCHQLSNNAELGGGLFWPPSLGFVHVSEVAPETVDGSVRYRLSAALTSTFLPVRARVLFDFLESRPLRRRGWGWTIGGRFTH